MSATADGPASAPRFLADVMLERLARWLRAAGVDARSAPGTAPDDAVRALAAAEGRVLLTRDRRLAEACAAPGTTLGGEMDGARCYQVRAGAPLVQFVEVAGAFGLGRPALTFTRCLVCNTPLRPAAAAEVFRPPAAPVPADKPLFKCPGCGRVYWEGAHTRRMRLALARALADAPAVEPGPPGGHAACPPPRPPNARLRPSASEHLMSGSPGGSSPGTKAGRGPRNSNHDVTARHGDDTAHGARHSDDTGASTSARPTISGEADTRRQDPDDPADTHANQSEE